VCVHALLDGRDVPETSALDYVDRLEALLAEINAKGGRRYCIASGGGRMKTTMDRYENDWGWWSAAGTRRCTAKDGSSRARARPSRPSGARSRGSSIKYLPSFVVGGEGKPVAPMKDGDSVIFFNYRW